jgi:nucleoprotein TPR
MSEDAQAKSNELASAVKELQRLLQEASTQYGELETKLAQAEEDYRSTIRTREEAIIALKEELKHANTLLDAVKQGMF